MIDSFHGQYSFLSNFWMVDIAYNGIFYPSVEHAYQAAKTLNMLERGAISVLEKPGEAKRMGKTFTTRPNWATDRLRIMKFLVWQKFSYPELWEKLQATNSEHLIEGNSWGDTFWGMCNGQGQNHLGKILMWIRDES